MKVQKYKHDCTFSYTLGATITYELLKCHPEYINNVYVHSSANQTDSMNNLLGMCEKNGISVIWNDKIFNILSPKGNCYVIAEFQKPDMKLSRDSSHIVLVNTSDSGNLGSIIRTAVGFDINDIAVIKPAVDCFEPHTVRASMGALFHANIEYFDNIESYRKEYPEHSLYAFMLNARKSLSEISDVPEPFSLVFGNEASGLPDEYASFCESVIIRNSSNVDSLNLSTAVAIATYVFTKPHFN